MTKNELAIKVLGDLTVYSKYARYRKDLGRREVWSEIVDRNKEMHLEKYPQLTETINWAYQYVYDRKVLPSMRSMQFAGPAILQNNSRMFNCAYLPVDSWNSFNEIMFLLLGGTGDGYSVQKHHVAKLPQIVKPNYERKRTFLIEDSIMGWADAVRKLMKVYFFGGDSIVFDYSAIREKGAELVTAGGKAPGPEPLRICLTKIESILREKEVGSQLTTVEASDIVCIIADAVLAGGIRRAALIGLFSHDDEDMLAYKAHGFGEIHPERYRANISAVLDRKTTTKEEFLKVWHRAQVGGNGEPGIYWTNDLEWGTNPCCEIGLRPYQFCNLVEINAATVENEEDLFNRCRAASIIASLQAGYTNFTYIRPIWQRHTEKDALLGVSMTGIAGSKVLEFDLTKAAEVVKEVNQDIADRIGTKPAARTTCVKPAGTTSLVLGTSSGIHAWHAPYYIRRFRVGLNEPLYDYISKKLPELLEVDEEKPTLQAIVKIPQKAPDGAVTGEEGPFSLLNRIEYVSENWVKPGHRDGVNTHNVSATVTLKPEDWELACEWMWENRDKYNGLSVFPHADFDYVQPPFEEISKEEYERLLAYVEDIDLTQVTEAHDNTDLKGELACAGNACELP